MRLLPLALLAAACEPIGVDKPQPPDVSALVAGYRAPTGVLTDANAQTVVDALEAKLSIGEAVCGWDAAADLVCAGDPACPLRTCEGLTDLLGAIDEVIAPESDAGPAEDAGPRAGDVVLRGEGFVRVTRICPGDGPEPVPDEANGKMELTLGFTDRGIDPVVWGTVEECLLRVQESVRVQGDVVLVLGDGPWRPSDPFSPLFQLEGNAETADLELTVAFDFGFDLDAQELRLRFATDAGEGFVFFVGLDATGFRAAGGIEWTCHFGAQTCTSDGLSVSW